MREQQEDRTAHPVGMTQSSIGQNSGGAQWRSGGKRAVRQGCLMLMIHSTSWRSLAACSCHVPMTLTFVNHRN